MNKKIVYWKGICVGEMLCSKVDNFFEYGKWKPYVDVPELSLFLQEIEVFDEAYVCCGNIECGFIATVQEVPSDYIEVVCRGVYRDLKTVIHTSEYYESLSFKNLSTMVI
ncbi:hypothetical protein HV127_20625 [Klebsiella sp. RHBSTW-00215]|uniref:hypothetical protein n=1 Tax=Klebsiella sp. RHBSTW-00215 TaxID=2742640 RepID=UPI0015F60997|nr:hypothetical protein [Klebsiella sp. RHBSTW-00215]MBA7933624.1 hypothetical protein [Klebsiella sp. RHBSTW-00215]